MCELLAMSANTPTDIVFSFTGLAERGGRTGPHVDGWGISFYEGKGYRTFKDAKPSSQSNVAEHIKSYPIKSEVVIGHIRQANRGVVSLENTHPFTRTLWGRYWTFAHNGQLHDYLEHLTTSRYQVVGETDSELAFCWLVESMINQFGNERPPADILFPFLAEKGKFLQSLGVFNMLLTDGDYLMIYCSNNLSYLTRKAPFGEAKLIDTDIEIDFRQQTTANDIVSIIATRPLTQNEQWTIMKSGDWAVFHKGQIHYKASAHEKL